MQHTLHRTLLAARHRESVFVFHTDLPGHVSQRYEAFVGSQYAAEAGAFALVRRAIHGEQIIRIVRELHAFSRVSNLGPGLPCVLQGNHVIDLHGGTRVLPRVK